MPTSRTILHSERFGCCASQESHSCARVQKDREDPAPRRPASPVMNAFQPNVMPEDGFWRTTPRCPRRAGRSRAGKRSAQSAVKKSSCVGGRAAGAGRRVQNRIERVGHSREWVASGCAVRRTWRSGIIGYHYESRPTQRLLLIEPPGASTVGTATMIFARPVRLPMDITV